MANRLIEVSEELAGITRTLEPHVVSVRARRHYPSSGLRWGADTVVTADHTVQRDEDISVTLSDGRALPASVLGRDPGSDLALLKVEGIAPGAQLAHASAVTAGELALVVGRSPDSGVNASLGIVSAVSGPWQTWRRGRLDAYIRLDARLFPQSSGGAVVNARGELVGIATSALSRIAGLAIPVSTVARVAQKLIEQGFVPRAYLGVGVQPVPFTPDLRKKLGIANESGLILLTVESGGPADKAGLLIGDILVGVGEVPIGQTEDLQAYSDSATVGSPARVKYIRGGALQEATVVIGERPRRGN